MDIEHLVIYYTDYTWEAQNMANRGYEPIECAFGDGSVMGALHMDHHGRESWREGVALRAWRDFFGARLSDPRFVVTGTPDADSILAIISLAAIIPQQTIPAAFVDIVNRRDIDPISTDLLEEPYGEELLAFQQISNLHRDSASFFRAIRCMCDILLCGLEPERRAQIRKRELKRIEMADLNNLELLSEYVALVQGNVWGFDRWYRSAPIIVSYGQRHQSITIGCRSEQIANHLLGKGGLLNVFPILGQGWGGRESIGGSPRDQKFSFAQARDYAAELVRFMNNQALKSAQQTPTATE
jgi:hypothetical protein